MIDLPSARKERGAFFTPPAIADFLAGFAVKDADAKVLDPTCGEAVFLLAAAEQLEKRGAVGKGATDQLSGVDLHGPSLTEAAELLAERDWRARLVESDFFSVPTPDQLGDTLGWQDAVVGNPPFVRYQEHRGVSRERSLAAAAAQGVRLSGLASSWAAALVHSAAFLKPSGRLAMVLPAELLTVQYAEPVRRWLRERFASVTLVMFDELQFHDAEAQVVLLLAHGQGRCDSFVLHHVRDASELSELGVGDGIGASPAPHGKWTDMSMPHDVRQLFRTVSGDQMVPLRDYGQPELGLVTGANDFFALTEPMRRQYGIAEAHLRRLSPPGTRHLTGTVFSSADWQEAKRRGDRVWLFSPETTKARGVLEYIQSGEDAGIHTGYKCRIRSPWWRPPAGVVPDLFFTYMSHRYPRLITNDAGVQFVNSMHGLRLNDAAPREVRHALPLLALNSATMLGAETMGRSYGGGILKMEPREAAELPMPQADALTEAWGRLRTKRAGLERALEAGHWAAVVGEVDQALLGDTMKLSPDAIGTLRDWTAVYRVRRTRQTEGDVSEAALTRRASRVRPAAGSRRPVH